MLDHMGIHVSDLERSKRFYAATLAELGLALVQDNRVGDARWLVFAAAPGRTPFFVVADAGGRTPEPIHLAFVADSRDAVDRFHAAGLAAGGRNNGLPGPRPSATPYYAAYLLDPDGLNVEAGWRSK